MCTFRVSSHGEDAERAAVEAGLEPVGVWRDGLHVPSGRPIRGAAERPPFGFNVGVSNRAWDDLTGQFVDALAFLEKHRAFLERLATIPSARRELDFPTNVDPSTRHVIVWSGAVPDFLCRAAGALGVDVRFTVYFATKAKT